MECAIVAKVWVLVCALRAGFWMDGQVFLATTFLAWTEGGEVEGETLTFESAEGAWSEFVFVVVVVCATGSESGRASEWTGERRYSRCSHNNRKRRDGVKSGLI